MESSFGELQNARYWTGKIIRHGWSKCPACKYGMKCQTLEDLKKGMKESQKRRIQQRPFNQ